MNCKPNQLAIVVLGYPQANLGRVIRCLALDEFATRVCASPMWTYDGELTGMLGNRSSAVADSCLKPINDPGADAIDEMVLKVGPAPMTLTEIWEAAHG